MTVAEGDPELNAALDVDSLADALRRDGRVHIPNILTEGSAARVHRCLEQETDFSLLVQTGPDQAESWRVATLAPQKEAELMKKSYSQARNNFDYLYDAHNLTREGEPYLDSSHYLARVTSFLNSSALLNFARRVTGASSITFASAQATRYRPGHFLNQHNDINDPRRVAAFVFNLTPIWRPDWGGALLFSDAPGHIAEGYLPTFNALNIFSVPQEHMVSYIAPFAAAARYSITGWFSASI
jgi:SM-20-related protein